MSDLTQNDYSSFWIHCIIVHVLISVFYIVIFWTLYYYHYTKNKQTPKDRLLISTNTISSIHCFIVFVGSITSFFYDELYKLDNMVLSKTGMLAYIWVFWNSYMIADIIGHIILYSYYPATTIKRRYDILIHHIVSYLIAPIIEIPTPIYGWFVLLWPPITELSSIFLNFQWFGKHYKWKDNTQKNIKLCFLITWFGARLPALWIQIIWTIIFWDDIVLWPYHSWITGVIATVTINFLHIIWTIFIIKGLCHSKKTDKVHDSLIDINKEIQEEIQDIQTKPKQIHGVSIEFNL